MAQTSSTPLAALLLAAGIAFAGWQLAQGLQQFRNQDRSITVKGLAERDVKSDFAIWTLSFRRAASEFAEVQRTLSEDRQRILDFLKEQGFNAEEIQPQPLQIQDLLAREYGSENVALRYNGQGRITIKSSQVERVAQAASAINPLIAAGVQLGGNGEGDWPRYQLRGFNDIKPLLLSEATHSAHQQASQFATDAGARLGPIKHANQGTIRILDDDGSDLEDGHTIGKRLRVVSTFEYALQ